LSIDWCEQLSANRRWLEKVVRCRLGDAHDADDVLQEVALAVLPHSNLPTEPEKVAPWLYRLTIRKVINARRALGRRRRMVEAFAYRHENTQFANSDACSWLMRKEASEALRSAINELSGEDKEILTLKYTENWSYQELASHLGVSEKTIEYRLMRARKKLASQLNREETLQP
jgi:RNA polymerase sigma factor (sigma-70 family)